MFAEAERCVVIKTESGTLAGGDIPSAAAAKTAGASTATGKGAGKTPHHAEHPAPTGDGPVCRRSDCQEPAWRGKKGNFCSRRCRDARPDSPVCPKPGCSKLAFRLVPGNFCSIACRDSESVESVLSANRSATSQRVLAAYVDSLPKVKVPKVKVLEARSPLLPSCLACAAAASWRRCLGTPTAVSARVLLLTGPRVLACRTLQAEDTAEACPVCQMSWEEGEEVCDLPFCQHKVGPRHRFHTICVKDTFLARRLFVQGLAPACPLCRAEPGSACAATPGCKGRTFSSSPGQCSLGCSESLASLTAGRAQVKRERSCSGAAGTSPRGRRRRRDPDCCKREGPSVPIFLPCGFGWILR